MQFRPGFSQFLIIPLLFVAAGCAGGDNAAPAVTLYDDLGDYSRTITTESVDAQAYFDQGLRLTYGLSHCQDGPLGSREGIVRGGCHCRSPTSRCAALTESASSDATRCCYRKLLRIQWELCPILSDCQ